MIKLMDKMEIITRHLDGKSNRCIAKELGINRKTVNKYVAEFSKAQSILCDSGSTNTEQIRAVAEEITAEPVYKKRKSPSRKWNQEMDDFLDEILTAEKHKKEVLHTEKQQLTKTQIHQMMVEAGFDIGLTTVCEKINAKRARTKEVFIAQKYEYGQRFEYDFCEVKLEIAGKVKKLQMAIMTAPASGYRFALLYHSQRVDVFIDSQVKFFEHLGGCFKEGVYDNMRNVVSRFIGKGEKQLNKNLVALSLYYGFKVNVTNCFAGNEKGSVEESVKVVRNAAFASCWQFGSVAEAQTHLNETLEKLNADKPIEEEKKSLTPYRPPFEVAQIRPQCLVDKYSCVRIDNVSYSVPDSLVGKHVCVKVYPNEIVASLDGHEIARHERSYVKGDMVIDISHYLKTFLKKPAALAHSRALLANEELKTLFDANYTQNPREFITILLEYADDFDEAIYQLRMRAGHILPDSKTPDTDHIAKQTLNQISRINTIGRSAA